MGKHLQVSDELHYRLVTLKALFKERTIEDVIWMLLKKTKLEGKIVESVGDEK